MPPLVPRARWSRRQALVAGLLLPALGGGAAGCGLDLAAVRRDDVPPPTPPVPGPDDLARVAAVRAATALRDGALAAAETRPDLAPLLTRIAADHDAHLAQLGPPPDEPPSEPSSEPSEPSEPSSETSPSSSAPPAAPADPAAPARAEAAAATEALGEAGRTSGPLARLLVSVAASRAAHAVQVSAALGLAPPAPPVTTFGAVATLDSPAPPSVAPAAVSPDGGAALVALVDGEHAAAYAYGVLAVRLTGEPRAAALRAIDRHRTAARRVAALAAAAGLSPRPAEVAYPVPPVPDSPAASALAADLELRLATTAAALVGTADGDLRLLGADVVVARCLAALAWRSPLPALPGLPEHGS